MAKTIKKNVEVIIYLLYKLKKIPDEEQIGKSEIKKMYLFFQNYWSEWQLNADWLMVLRSTETVTK